MLETITQSLVARATGGDADSFRRLMELFWPDFEARLQRKLSPDTHADIPGLIDSAFLKARQKQGIEPLPAMEGRRGKPMVVEPFNWDRANAGNPVAQFRAWCWSFVYREVGHYLQRRKRRPGMVSAGNLGQGDEGANLIDQVAVGSETPSRVARRRELEKPRELLPQKMEQAMKALLTPQQAEALRLKYGHGLAAAEVAERLGVSPECVRQWCSRGLKQLRDELRGQSSLFDSIL